jgi:hypothetical protein
MKKLFGDAEELFGDVGELVAGNVMRTWINYHYGMDPSSGIWCYCVTWFSQAIRVHWRAES